ncbi:MAG TPA: hypothetical protein VMZ00_15480 [Sporichthya sp.]|nr:hypothetical protein [Sporichthya sp.]
MSGRTWSRAAIVALAVALPVAPAVTTAASAASGSVVRVASHGHDGGGKDDRADQGKHKQKGKKAHAKFNLGGRLTAVDPAAGTVTFRVHGGQVKAVRGTELTVVLAPDARVRRNDAAATLADFQVGDKVRAKGVRTADVWTANRVKAESPRSHTGDDGENSSS